MKIQDMSCFVDILSKNTLRLLQYFLHTSLIALSRARFFLVSCWTCIGWTLDITIVSKTYPFRSDFDIA
uniref:Putative salivary kunitz domain protein n=1 Tax=Ixodes ricinus TaxID=34613 RepID=A0A0K8RKH8_IXORI